MSSNIGFILNHRDRSLELVTAPYFQSKNIVCATNIHGEDVACNPADLYLLTDFNCKQCFFEAVRDSFRAPISTTARSTYTNLLFTMLNGVCILHVSPEEKYSIQFSFEKGVKLNEKIVLYYDVSTSSYTVSTDGYARRKARYEVNKTIPKGESYDRIILVLNNFGNMSTADIAKVLGLTENRISGRISEMYKCGLIHKCGRRTSPEGRTQTLWALSNKKKYHE